MAITNAIMQMRRGLEADFDPDKMRPGEWAVSTDKKYVRICFSAGVCVRMATYDAFEKDMAAIQDILAECQIIEQAVTLINTQISANAQAVAEYTAQAKQYRDEAKQFRDEAETSATNAKISEENARRVAESLPEDYTDLSKAFYNTAIKQKAVGDNIHVTDSAEARNVEFGLYGKAEQKQYSGKNLLDNTATTQTINGVTFTVNEDKSVTANGTVSGTTDGRVYFNINLKFKFTKAGTYILNGCPSGGSSSTWRLLAGIKYSDGTYFKDYIEYGSGVQFEVTQEMIDSSMYAMVIAYIYEGVSANNITFYPMLRLASITDSTYEPYVGGIPSPNPDYPQEITVSGSDGSIEVVSCGKNLLENTASTMDRLGITFTVNDDGSVTASGTATGRSAITVKDKVYLKKVGAYKLSGCPNGGSETTYRLLFGIKKADGTFIDDIIDYGNGASFSITQEMIDSKVYGLALIYVFSGYTANNLTFKPMIRLASDTDDTYEPYTETVSTIPTPNGLCGIKVSSGGNYTDENGQQWICDEVVKYAYGSGKRIQRIGVIESYNGEEITTDYMSTTGQLTTGAKVLYILQESITTDLSAEEIAEIEKLHTFYPITNIFNDADCGMSITYLADSKNYIDGQLAIQKAQQEEALATMLLLMPEEVQASMIENDTNNLLNESEV